MKFFAPLLGLLAAALSPADAVKGVDVSQKCMPSGWKCLKEDGTLSREARSDRSR